MELCPAASQGRHSIFALVKSELYRRRNTNIRTDQRCHCICCLAELSRVQGKYGLPLRLRSNDCATLDLSRSCAHGRTQASNSPTRMRSTAWFGPDVDRRWFTVHSFGDVSRPHRARLGAAIRPTRTPPKSPARSAFGCRLLRQRGGGQPGIFHGPARNGSRGGRPAR